MNFLRGGLFVTAAFTLLGATARAADTWTGTTSANWSENNWTGGNNPPQSGDSLIFTSATGAGGTLLNNDLTSSAFNLANITYSSGAAPFTVSGNAFNLAGNVTNSSTSLETINDPFSLAAAQVFATTSGGGNIVLGGSLTGPGGITAAGPGVVTLSGANSYSGTTIVNGGTLFLNNGSALPAITTLTVNNGGVVDLNGSSQAITNFGAGGLLGIITNSASSAASLTFSNMTAGLNTLVADGANGSVALNFFSFGSAAAGSINNTNNTFSGGLTLGNLINGSGYARLSMGKTTYSGVPGNITNSPFGRGTITIGRSPIDRVQFLCNNGGVDIFLNNIVFNSPAGADRFGAFRVDATTLILAGTLTANMSPLCLSCNSTGTGFAYLTGQVTGTNGLWLRFNTSATTSYMTCILSNLTANANNYQGGTEIDAAGANAFILKMGAANQMPNGANTSDVTNNGTFNLNGFNQTIDGLWGVGTVDGGSGAPTLTIGANNDNSTNSCTIKNTLGSLSLTKTGTGILTLTGVLSYNGNTTVNGGILSVQQPNFSSSSTITIAAGGTLDLPNGGTFAVANLYVNGVQKPSGTYSSTTDPGYITGSGKLTVTGGSASDTWTGATSANWSQNNWTGGRTPPISGDSLNFTSATGVGGTILNNDLTTSTFQIAGISYSANAAGFTVNGGAFTLAGAISNNAASPQTINDSFALASAEVFSTTNSGGNLTLGGTLSGPGGVTAAGPGTLTLSGANNSYAGETTVSSGKLLLGNATALPTTTTLYVVNGSILDLSSNGGSIANFDPGSGYGGVITNSASGTNVSTLTVSSWSIGLNTLVADGATAPVALNFQSIGTAFGGSLNNNTNTFSGGLTIGNVVTGTGYARLGLNTVPVSTGVPGNIISSPFGRGTITVGNLPSDKAQLFLDAGNSITVLNNIVCNTTLGADRVGGLRVDQTYVYFAGTLTANQADVSFSCNNTSNGTNAAIVTGQITGPAGLWLEYNNASPTAIINVTLDNVTANANNYQGDTEVDAPHVLVLGADNQIPHGATAGNLILDGKFALNGHNQTINGLGNNSNTGIIDGMTGTPTLTIGDNDSYNEFDGVIQNSSSSLSLVKIGAGNEDLTGTNTYSGNTTVNEGTLEFGQPGFSQYGTVTVASGATLQLDFSTTNTVAGLVLNGVSQPNGLYNNTTSPNYITGAGNLLVAQTVPNTPTSISYSVSGSTMTISWPPNYAGWILQDNTNLNNGSGWLDIPGTGSVVSTNLLMNQKTPAIFFRLRYP